MGQFQYLNNSADQTDQMVCSTTLPVLSNIEDFSSFFSLLSFNPCVFFWSHAARRSRSVHRHCSWPERLPGARCSFGHPHPVCGICGSWSTDSCHRKLHQKVDQCFRWRDDWSAQLLGRLQHIHWWGCKRGRSYTGSLVRVKYGFIIPFCVFHAFHPWIYATMCNLNPFWCMMTRHIKAQNAEGQRLFKNYFLCTLVMQVEAAAPPLWLHI